MNVNSINDHYLYPGTIFANNTKNYIVTTVLGSCVSVCLWDSTQNMGCMNHYMLPYQTNSELSPRYGDTAIYQLIQIMQDWGCQRNNMIAKVFGGGSVLQVISPYLSVGERNIQVAKKLLNQENINIASSDLGGEKGRKVKFDTRTGIVSVKKITKSDFIHEYLK